MRTLTRKITAWLVLLTFPFSQLALAQEYTAGPFGRPVPAAAFDLPDGHTPENTELEDLPRAEAFFLNDSPLTKASEEEAVAASGLDGSDEDTAYFNEILKAREERDKFRVEDFNDAPDPFSPSLDANDLTIDFRIEVGIPKNPNKVQLVEIILDVVELIEYEQGGIIRSIRTRHQTTLEAPTDGIINLSVNSTWDGKDESGQTVSDGHYTYRAVGALIDVKNKKATLVEIIRLRSEIIEGSILLDQTGPELQTVQSPVPNANSWNNTDVTVSFLASDEGSGIQSVTPDIVVSAEGAGQIVSGTAVDQAGNTSTVELTLNIDKTAPVVRNLIPAEGAELTEARPLISAEFSDALSGIDLSAVQLLLDGTDVTGQAVVDGGIIAFTPNQDLTAGEHTFEVRVLDLAGNQTIAQSTFSFIPPITPPVIEPIGDQNVVLGSTLTFQVQATDPNGDEVTFSALPLPLPENASFNAKTGVFSFKPSAAQVGTFPLTFIASDGIVSSSETINITVNPPPAGQPTALTGRLLDTNDFVNGTETPIAGATVTVLGSGIFTLTDENGFFTLEGLPSGDQVFDIETSTALPGPGGALYAGFREKINLIDSAQNIIDRPFFLPRIDPVSLTTVDPDNTTVVVNSNLGITMEIPPMTARNQDGSLFTGQISISEVPDGLAPAALPRELEPGLLITIQPVGVTFDTPVPVTFPNTDNLPAGSRLLLWSLDPNTGVFGVVGVGQVTSDERFVETISGGVRAADWHMVLPRQPVVDVSANNSENQDQTKCAKCDTGSETTLDGGDLIIDHQLVNYRSLGDVRTSRLIYHSLQADPQPIIAADATVLTQSGLPLTLSSQISVAGNIQGVEIFTGMTGLDPNRDPTVKQIVQFDAREIQTGRYPYEITLSSNFASSTVADIQTGNVLIRNEQQSLWGSGWSLEGVDRLMFQNEDAILAAGDGTTVFFDRPDSSADRFTIPVKFEVGEFVGSIVKGDFNEDGILDRIIGGSESIEGVEVTNFYLLLGDGRGGFAAPSVFAVSVFPRFIKTTDFNNDGHLDLVMASSGFNTDYISIFQGNGRGSFSDEKIFQTGFAPEQVAIQDFNEDGNLDLAVTNRRSSSVSLLFGDGLGDFSPAVNFGLSLATKIGAGDFNEDGHQDLAITSDDPVAVFFGDGSGNFSFGGSFDSGGNRPSAIALEDINQDGHLDMVVVNGPNDNIGILFGSGTGSFSAPIILNAADSPKDLVVEDFNQDGNLDLLVTNTGGEEKLSLFLSDGAGSFEEPIHFLNATDTPDPFVFRPSGITIGDLNGDGILDIALSSIAGGVFTLLGLPEGFNPFFLSSTGDFSMLVENQEGTFARRLKDGTQIHFDQNGLQTSVVDLNGHTTSYEYDALDRLIRVIDPAGLITTYDYINGFLSSITDPIGRATLFEHDDFGNLIRITDPDGTFRQFEYDERHRLIRMLDQDGGITTYEYNFAGRNVRAVRPDGSVREVTPVETLGLPDLASGIGTALNPAPVVRPEDIFGTFRDGENNVTQFGLNTFGASTGVTDALGRQVTVIRDENSNPIRIISADGTVTDLTYDEKGNLLTSTDQTTGQVTSFTYDPRFDRVTSVTDALGNVTQTSYDENGNVVEVTNAGGTKTQMVYADPNCRGFATSVINAAGLDEETVTNFVYDSVTCNVLQVMDSLGGVTAFTYDAVGNVTSVNDPNGNITRYTYDVMNRLINVEDAIAGITSYAYDAKGNVISIMDALGNVTTFEYDAEDRLIRTTDALGFFETFAYDANGNVISTTDKNGQIITFEYDALNRLIQKTLPGNEITTFDYDINGNLTSVVDPDSALAFTYDHLNRLTSASTAGSPDQPEVTINYTYDANGNRIAMTDDLAGTTNYVYDNLNRLTNLINPSGHSVDYTYDALSRLTAKDFSNGVSTTYAYDSAGQLLDLHTSDAVETISRFSYTYDDLGNRTSMTTVRSIPGINSSITYNYDSLNRLTNATDPIAGLPAGEAGEADESFTYDELGNRIQADGDTQDAVFDALNRLLEDSFFMYAYDNNGNLIQKTEKATSETTLYSYDAEDRLIRIDFADGGFAEYRYDGLGRRIEKSLVSGLQSTVSRYIYDGEDILYEFNELNEVVARFTHGPGIDEPLILERFTVDPDTSAVIPAEAGIYFYHTDALGSITELTDITGSVAEHYVYDAFGNTTIYDAAGSVIPASPAGWPESLIGNPYTYTGREFDIESGLYYYRARYYDARIGRFLQEDPVGGNLADSQSLNRYTYVSNNPVNFIDPTGQFGELVNALINFSLNKLLNFLFPKLKELPNNFFIRLARRGPDFIEEGARLVFLFEEDIERIFLAAAAFCKLKTN